MKFIEEALRKIVLPPLTRPPVGPMDDATEELVRWGITMHVYSVVTHVRTVLSGLLTLADAGNTPSANILARHVFEWTAHSCYMLQELKNSVATQDWSAAFELLLRANTGNAWAKTHGPKYDAIPSPFEGPKPIRINKLIAAYVKHQEKMHGESKVEDTYGFLSEYSHPNSACFVEYLDFSEADARFVPPPSRSSFGGLNGFILEWLLFLQELLGLADEYTVRNELIKILAGVVQLAKPEESTPAAEEKR